MIAYLLYNRQTPGERQMQELARRLEPLQVASQLIDADSPPGIQLASAYDILDRPAIVLARDDGTAVQTWSGDPDQLPPPADISYLAHQ